jgi:N-methylhydantoinase A/oxoprolinase/acetone carboxylase beta subunit/N-methylhydantoinase B/oxoprolinase/acetone carboxylase alpha subunit
MTGQRTSIGVDVGGTFTDVALIEGSRVVRVKSPTAAGDVATSVIDGIALLARRLGRATADVLADVGHMGLGTTAVTNVLASRTGVRVGVITTAGIEDELPLAKGFRVSDGVWSRYPEPLVPRDRIIGLNERVDRHGEVLKPLDLAEAIAAARVLVDDRAVAVIVVSLLWSFRYPQHEERATAAIMAEFPGVAVLSAAKLQPALGEFERTAHAVLNAYTSAAVATLDTLATRLQQMGLRVPVLLVHSGGGVMTLADARNSPIWLASSGPAAGVAAATSLAARSNELNVVFCDMGGTSFDVSLSSGTAVPRRDHVEIAGLLTTLSMIDIQSIGAGGGSIGWVDARGMLRVGPRSAGAFPGPACYGRGGTEPTVTDALLVLGYLDAKRFLGGDMALDVDKAYAACEVLGRQVGLTADDCAWGIRRLALDGMATAVRSLLDERGLIPADHSIASYGGCGPMFAADIAAELGIRRVRVSELSSVLSAFGAATIDIRRERMRSLGLTVPLSVEELQKVAEELRTAVLADLAADGVPEEARSVRFEASMKFKRQTWELTIAVPGSDVDERAISDLEEMFRAEYGRRYGAGSMMLGAPVELAALRVVGVGANPMPVPDVGRPRRESGDAGAWAGERSVGVARGSDARSAVLVFDGLLLRRGDVVDGPALIDESDTTIWVPDGSQLEVDATGDLVLTISGQRGRPLAEMAADDPISLELLRSQLVAVAEEAASAIERTAISPVVVESKDYSATLLDPDGNLIAGGGPLTFHWVAATRVIRATRALFGDTIAPGDVFIANDPYNGGGLHPNDVFVQRPVFVGDRLVAWAALAAHLIDMGGMSLGSFSPDATDCYQEALRIPPVRILREGVEQADIWSIFRTNVRLEVLVEMDLRALVSGANVAHDKIAQIASARGVESFCEGAKALQRLSEQEFRRRIARLADGRYKRASWVEWDQSLYYLPCELTVKGDELHFDFTGVAPQTPHFFNSQPYIIKSEFMMQAGWILGSDLPYTEGLLAPVHMTCPEGSLVHSTPPAPLASGHMHVGMAAAEMMTDCLKFAIWATGDTEVRAPVIGEAGYSALALTTWSGIGNDGVPDTFIMMDGAWAGASASEHEDGSDLNNGPVGPGQPAQFPDVEVLETWYPILIENRALCPGPNGAGHHRSGSGTLLRFRPHGTEQLIGQMIAMRGLIPLEGVAGGRPGATTQLWVHGPNGSTAVSPAAGGVRLDKGSTFEIRCASGGGFGDPLSRPVGHVSLDVTAGRLSVAEALGLYGVLVGDNGEADEAASTSERDARRAARLRDARPARIAPPRSAEEDLRVLGEPQPLYPGVVRRGRFARAIRSGAVLAEAPTHWTDGCPVLDIPRPGSAVGVVERAYLDPRSGEMLYVEAVLADQGRSFEIAPEHWTRPPEE